MTERVDPQAASGDFAARRRRMAERELAARGIRSPHVVEAISRVPREAFLPDALHEFAYEDTPLPISEGQTISQPSLVAAMVEALQLEGGERVLEVGTGSGYAAAVLAELADEVVTIERYPSLAHAARGVLHATGYDRVTVVEGDGTLGWRQGAPYDAILVSAGGPGVPKSLEEQLVLGGRLVIPIGPVHDQVLVRVTRTGPEEYEQERLEEVAFVPLVGAEGWADRESAMASGPPMPDFRDPPAPARAATPATAELLAAAAEPFDDLEEVSLAPLLERIGDARIVLIGDATHGTSEFYRFRARITRELIERRGFEAVAVEADWPDAARIDRYVRDRPAGGEEWTAFARFPTWMWRNEEVREFVEWLREHNLGAVEQGRRVGFHGLDLYSMFGSIGAVLDYLGTVDEEAARVARERYGCLTPWQSDPATYGRAAASGRFRDCRDVVAEMLADLLAQRLEYLGRDGEAFFDALQNARLIANAERYYRAMYEVYDEGWNLRDSHMFETLEALLEHRGPHAKAVVWAHNSHVGVASATDMAARGEHNVGELCRQAFGDDAYVIGMGTHSGTVAAASDWDAPMEVMQVAPSLPGSWERLAHDTGIPAFLVGLRHADDDGLRERLRQAKLQRAIGVIYRPESERASHYFMTRLAEQFDEYVWFDETEAVAELDAQEMRGVSATYPFGL